MKKNFRHRDFSSEDHSLPDFDPNDTQPVKRVERTTPDFSDELLGLKSKKHIDTFARDYSDKDLQVFESNETQPTKRVVLSDATKNAVHISALKKPSDRPRFNWLSFWTMLVSITVVVLLVIFVPGPFDEIAAAIALSAINAFIANYRK